MIRPLVIRGPVLTVPEFSEGLARVKLGGKWEYLDRNGKPVIPCRFDRAEDFYGGMAAVGSDDATGDTKWGYIHKTGKLKVRPRFDTASDFKNGLASVCLGKRCGYINKAGQYVWEPTR